VPLGAAIVLLYLLKLRRREQTVSSVILWQDAVADIQANAPFQKLKKNLLLLLQLVILLMLVAATGRPFVRVRGVSENKIVVILDASASMRATDISPSRFEAAKARAKEIVSRMGHGDTMLLISASAKARVTAPFTADKRLLASAISNLKPVGTPCNMHQAMALALSLVRGRSAVPARIVVISDGGFGPMTDLPAGSAKVEFVSIGKRCDNVAITGLASRKTLSGDQQLFIGLRNFSTRERKSNLEIYLGDQLLDIRELSLTPGETKQEILKETTRFSGRITAKLDISDDLAADNTGTVYLSKSRRISILLVSKGNIFLQNALNLDPRTQLTRAQAVPSDFSEGKYDMVVFDRVAPPASLPLGGYLLLDTDAAEGPARTDEPVSRPTIVDFDRMHPAVAYVDFGGVRILQAHYLRPTPWASAIIEGTGGPLGVAGSKNGRRFVQLSWNLLDSDFPLRVAFPVFIANCLDWLVPPDGDEAGQSVRTGQPVYIDVPPNTERLSITNPDGQRREVRVTQSPMPFDDTERIGVYSVQAKGLRREFACNLSSASESEILPSKAIRLGGRSFASSGGPVQTSSEFYWPLILLALAALAFEWYAYHRRL
jgi:Ca-activated chloride channel homolog